MKLIIVLSVIACSYGAKLDRTYLPPSNSATAGGSPAELRTPSSGFGGNGGLGQVSSSGFGQVGTAGLAKSGASSGFGQSGSAGFGQVSGPSGFGQSAAPSSYGQQSGSAGFGQSGAVGPQSYNQGSSSGFGQTPSSFDQSQGFSGQRYQQPERIQASADRNAENLRFDSQNDGETFSYSYETSNGISAEESGVATNGVQAQGGYSYTGDDGQSYRVSYTADENGYVPQGDHLPTPHPIPAEIMRSIEENARAAASGTQEGAYRPEEEDSPQQYNAASGSQSQAQNQGYNYDQPQRGQSGQQGAFNQGSNAAFGTLGGRTSNQPSGQYNQGAFAQQGPSARGSSGQYNQGSPTRQGSFAQGTSGQYNQGSSGPSGSQGSGFGRAQSQMSGGLQNQGESGYEYNRPQAGSSFGRISQAGPSSFSRPQSGSQSSGSFPAGPTSKGPFGPSSGASQGSFGPSSASQQYTRPEQPIGPAGIAVSRPGASNGQGGFGQSRSNQGAFGSPASQGSRPQGSQYQGGAAGRASAPIQAPYQYNRPGSQQSNDLPEQSGFGSQSQSGRVQSQTFGGPRQPPSFSEKEGYKY